jgi:hypothetical protein
LKDTISFENFCKVNNNNFEEINRSKKKKDGTDGGYYKNLKKQYTSIHTAKKMDCWDRV